MYRVQIPTTTLCIIAICLFSQLAEGAPNTASSLVYINGLFQRIVPVAPRAGRNNNLLQRAGEALQSTRLPRQQAEQNSLVFGDESDPEILDYDSLPLPEPEPIISEKLTADDNEKNITRMHEEAIQIRKVQIRDAIMSKLRLARLPNPRLANLLHRFPQHILGGNNGQEKMQKDSPVTKDEFHAKMKTVLRFPQRVPPIKASRISSSYRDKTIFIPLPLNVDRSNLKKAMFLLHVETPKWAEGQSVRVEVKTNRMTKKNVLFSRNIRLSRGGNWQHIDITKECRMWLKDEWKYNLGLVATAELRGVDLINYNTNQTINNDTIDRVPLIKLELNGMDNLMTKRALDRLPLACEPSDNEKRCCRYNFVLDFSELGSDFDFIISPKRYYANYCAGACPSYYLPNMPVNLGRRQVQRCCTPSHLDSLTLLYTDENNGIVQSELPGMTINSCSCD